MKFWVVSAAAFLVALLVSWTPLGGQFDNDSYDWMSRLFPASSEDVQAVVIGIDETTLQESGGMRSIRTLLAEVLEQIGSASRPKAVAIDFTLADRGDPRENARLANAMSKIPNLVLATDIAQNGAGWQDPLPAFAQRAKALGHVHVDPDPVCRWVQLDKAAGHIRRWAMGMEALAPGTIAREEGDAITWADYPIPSHRIRIVFSGQIPKITPGQISAERLDGKYVFVGATALTAARDRLMTPLGSMMAGVEMNAELAETLRTGRFRVDPSPAALLLIQVLFAALAAFAVQRLGYWAAALVVGAAMLLPLAVFRSGVVLPVFSLASTTWLPALAAGVLHFRATRTKLAAAEADRSRYQKAIHWVTHEMRTPLSAIQGSSELMTRYALPVEKQRQIADMINSESKRLAQMIQTFLNVERMSSGQLQIKSEVFAVTDLCDICIRRAAPLAGQKNQRIIDLTQEASEVCLSGDRELMEFAVYNLLTNAIKYSPEGTEIRLSAKQDNGWLRLSVIDQGMGIEPEDLKRLGTKFFRTQGAEESGIQGTGIGLSIVGEILTAHKGKLEISSNPGQGSSFTIILPAAVRAVVTTQQ